MVSTCNTRDVSYYSSFKLNEAAAGHQHLSAQNHRRAEPADDYEQAGDQERTASLPMHAVTDVTPGVATNAAAATDTGVSVAA